MAYKLAGSVSLIRCAPYSQQHDRRPIPGRHIHVVLHSCASRDGRVRLVPANRDWGVPDFSDSVSVCARRVVHAH